MPITAWHCPDCCRPVGLDHFADTACGEIVHPDFAAAVLADDRDKADRRGRVGVSDGTGCARRKIIGDIEDIIVDPLAYNSVLTGTAWHTLMETHGDSVNCEVEVSGTIAGIKLVGHIDRVRYGPPLVLDDHKHTNDYSFGYQRKGEATKPEHEAQLSIYAELFRQTFDLTPAHGVIWYHATAGGFLPRKVEFWPLERCLSLKPYGGEFSVMDLWLQVQGGLEGDWRNLPLAGESQSFGAKSACDYCAVREVCWTAARGAPF